MPTVSFLALFLITLIIPTTASASIFSKVAGLFSGDAKAESITTDDHNSQTAPVLEAKISPSGNIEKRDTLVQMSQDDVLIGEVGSLGTALDIEDYPEEDEINVYITKQGDTLSKIANMYNVSVNTIIWATTDLMQKKHLKKVPLFLLCQLVAYLIPLKKEIP